MGFKKNTLVIIDLDKDNVGRDKSEDRLGIVSTDTGHGSDRTNIREFNDLNSIQRVENNRLTVVNPKTETAYDETLGEHHLWLEKEGFFKRYDG